MGRSVSLAPIEVEMSEDVAVRSGWLDPRDPATGRALDAWAEALRRRDAWLGAADAWHAGHGDQDAARVAQEAYLRARAEAERLADPPPALVIPGAGAFTFAPPTVPEGVPK